MASAAERRVVKSWLNNTVVCDGWAFSTIAEDYKLKL